MSGDRVSFKQLCLILLDLTVINLSYVLTFVFRLGEHVPSRSLHAFVQVAPWISIAAVLIFYIFGLYSEWINQSLIKVIYSIVFSLSFLNLLAMGLIYLTQNFAVPRSVSILTPILELLILTTVRLGIWYFFQRMHSVRKVLVVGADAEESMAFAKKFIGYAKGRFSLSGFVHGKDPKEIEAQIDSSDVDIVAISSQLAQRGKIVDYCIKNHKEILIIPDMLAVLLYSSDTRYVDDTLMFALKPPGLKPGQQLYKRAFDIVGSLVLLVTLSPLLFLIALLIRITSPGPALFRQDRLGEAGVPFEVLKFRSMVEGAEEETGPVLAGCNDPRITKLGAFLRAARLDEIPQFINVLRGDMSLIGPRPEREFFVEQFSETIPYYRYRMAVKPGITGLAQVMGRYTTSAEDKLRFDLMYIRNYSFLLDLRILLLTIRVVFQREKAAGVELDLEDAVGKMAG